MKKRISILLLIADALLAVPARAQFGGTTVPQSITSTPFSATACTGAAQTATIANAGQAQHFMTLTGSGALGIRATIQGSHDGSTFNDISDVATTYGSTVMGQGYYPVVRVGVTCATATGTFTVIYSGMATSPSNQIGAIQSAQVDKSIAIAAPSNANFVSQNLRTPFGTSGGALYFTYSAAGPTGSVLNVSCGTLLISPSLTIVSYPLSTTTATQFFPVPALPCDLLTVTYTTGGASATTFNLSYVFNLQPITGGDPCQGSTAPKQSVAISLTATGKLVTELVGHSVFVCGFNFTLASGAAPVATAQLQSGTGATCGVGTVNLTGAMAGIASSTIPIVSPGGGYSVAKTSTGAGLCLALGGTTPSAQGILIFIQE